ncbi:serendipity locus protein alpha-like isoform X2 [Uranotaenia lowii]|uniref:serendipity locus protein alpha-like isoform X2 n=1 Tax=Uranotaenia lowii TaxID=190385 RepID=UPI00247AA283|nr:serendipity locus protein alpha-like isoform X2 [Uranotaenia lowii]
MSWSADPLTWSIDLLEFINSRKSTRQCFLDRIVWCITRIKTLTEQIDSEECTTESNFVNFLDLALSLISPMTLMGNSAAAYANDEDNAEALVRIRSVVEALITQVFAFGNVLCEQDKERLTQACQRVLRECIALERDPALDLEKLTSDQDRCLKAGLLEGAIYQLEIQANDCFLRLVYETFSELDRNLVGQMRKLVTDDAKDEKMDALADRFDNMVDRIMQIGLFTLSYADDAKVASVIRSCLASIEALDSYLIPSIYVPCVHHTKLLEEHWHEESSQLRSHVQRIIDSNAFALVLIDLLDGGIDKLVVNYESHCAEGLLHKAEVFRQHLELNRKDLDLLREPLSLFYEDFKMMLLECRAIVKYAREDPSIAKDRVVKRFRILLQKLRKIQQTISSGKGKEVLKDEKIDVRPLESMAKTDEEKEVDQSVKEFFSLTEARFSAKNILYRSRRGEPPSARRNSTASLLQLQSFSDVPSLLRKQVETTPGKGAPKVVSPDSNSSSKNRLMKRDSLRKAMFKRKQCLETADFFESFKSDVDLQITEILDQLTDLSSTFAIDQKTIVQNCTKQDLEHLEKLEQVEEQTQQSDRKSITKEEIEITDDNKICINITTDI